MTAGTNIRGWELSVQMQLGQLALAVDVASVGGTVALVGPNGSGKTSLLRTIAGAYRPDAGRMRLGTRELFDTARDLFVPPEARKIGYVPQGYGLFPHLRVVDNVAFGLRALGALVQRRQRARAQLEQLGCLHLADRLPARLSGGEQQRVALARALVVAPEMLLLDEPLAALDAKARRAMRVSLAAEIRDRGTPTVIVTHHLPDVLTLAEHVVVIESGRVVQTGSPSEVSQAPATAFVAEFFYRDDASLADTR